MGPHHRALEYYGENYQEVKEKALISRRNIVIKCYHYSPLEFSQNSQIPS